MRTAPSRPWSRRFAVGALSLVMLAGCGDDDDGSSDGNGDAADSSATTEAEAPTVLTSCANVPEAEGGPQNLGAVINVIDFEYCQPAVTVEVGEAVEFINNGGARHQIEHHVSDGSSEEVFKSQALQSGDEYVVTLEDPGTYDYICSFHSDLMSGTITVVAG